MCHQPKQNLTVRHDNTGKKLVRIIEMSLGILILVCLVAGCVFCVAVLPYLNLFLWHISPYEDLGEFIFMVACFVIQGLVVGCVLVLLALRLHEWAWS